MVKYKVSVSIYDTYTFDGGVTYYTELVHHSVSTFSSHSTAIDYAYEQELRGATVELEEVEEYNDTESWELLLSGELFAM